MEPVCYIHNASLTFFCPACKEPHCIVIHSGTNNNPCQPTIYGSSLRVRRTATAKLSLCPCGCGVKFEKIDYCHFFIVKGRIYYWSDSKPICDEVHEMVPIDQWYKPIESKVIYRGITSEIIVDDIGISTEGEVEAKLAAFNAL